MATILDEHGFIPACAGNAHPARQPHRFRPVHPRVCGERAAASVDAPARGGSSPRVRGTPSRPAWAPRPRRFIPACAGNANPRRTSRPRTTVHPRVCGERAGAPRRPRFNAGSSPRVRGTPDVVGGGQRSVRFIPACAGNARWSRRWPGAPPVHPRVCGERLRIGDDLYDASGSSPRVRGTPPRPRTADDRGRFIPACAGNACHRGPPGRASGGSSPRVRGTPRRAVADVRVPRFIPACAGNAAAFVEAALRHGGSSPRVRGTHEPCPIFQRQRRFIPACAGNAGKRRTCSSCSTVHPRVCGERDPIQPHAGSSVGSSPRVRGTRPGRRPPRFP